MHSKALLSRERAAFHERLLATVLTVDNHGVVSNADKGNRTSEEVARSIVEQIGQFRSTAKIPGQTAGDLFEEACQRFLDATFPRLRMLRPGNWQVIRLASRERAVLSAYDQYTHLKDILQLAKEKRELAAIIGADYVIAPDVVIIRNPEKDSAINEEEPVVDNDCALLTPIRHRNKVRPTLHASISCKWTMRSDRAQNARSEALNLARLRKGKTPHIAVVTAEPAPGRLASLAYGTGDIDCVYHFALSELEHAVNELASDEGRGILQDLIVGRRLRDISDLPLDLTL